MLLKSNEPLKKFLKQNKNTNKNYKRNRTKKKPPRKVIIITSTTIKLTKTIKKYKAVSDKFLTTTI